MGNKSNLPEFLKGRVSTAAQVLLNTIPYAGGSISTVFGNYLNDKRIEKITDAINSLAEKVKIADIVIEKLLTESQVCEMLEKHLNELASSSDEEKVGFLKNSLNNCFTDKTYEFQEKELFLNSLKNLTSSEIVILKQLYKDSDPFIDNIYPDISSSGNNHQTISLDVSYYTSNNFIPASFSYVQGVQDLEGFLEKKFQDKWMLIKGACLQLDSKGLSNIKENFKNNIRKIVQMKEVNPSIFLNPVSFAIPQTHNNLGVAVSKREKTPYEGSKTEFGIAFMKYINE